MKFLEQKKLREDSSHIRKCVERMIRRRGIISLNVAHYATDFAREIRAVDVGKLICSFDEALLSASVTVLFKKGNPLLDTFNILMRRCLEGGLLENIGQNCIVEFFAEWRQG